MKGRSVLWFMVTLVVLVSRALAVAQTNQYPTQQDVQRLTRGFAQRVERSEPYLSPANDPLSTRRLRSFVNAWSQVDSSVAPFLGYWTGGNGTDGFMMIFPSRIKGKVCVIGIDEGSAGFSLETVQNSQIRFTRIPHLLVRQGNYLGLIEKVNNQSQIYAYGAAKPLEPPVQSSILLQTPEASRVIQQFNTSGCTASLPNRR